MYAILFNEPGRLALRVADYITTNDYNDLRPLLDTALHSSDTARLYWEMDYFRGWKPDGLWKDLQFDLTVTADFARIALVGTTDTLPLIRPVMEAIFRAELRLFTLEQKTAAWEWFVEGSSA
ncbi:SpoIIAA family protein [Larkinella punicea]|uniref:STAS/SEC14 domain-containing protein n=1 Tax=Larkinella punicea TaxID=2315727 RepID=A0A368JH57_9BACT|nr:STAS/SEC14 domain-containing protein [Larkinella punicea]RCR67000.1 STAS/SEC14 domain-containing protein [Larkinella punicea]